MRGGLIIEAAKTIHSLDPDATRPIVVSIDTGNSNNPDYHDAAADMFRLSQVRPAFHHSKGRAMPLALALASG